MASNGEGMLQGLVNLGGTGGLLQDQVDEDYRRLQALEHNGSPALSRRSSGNDSSSSLPTMVSGTRQRAMRCLAGGRCLSAGFLTGGCIGAQEGPLCEEAAEEEEEPEEAASDFQQESLLESKKAAVKAEPPAKQGLGRPRERTSNSGSLVAKAKVSARANDRIAGKRRGVACLSSAGLKLKPRRPVLFAASPACDARLPAGAHGRPGARRC